LLVGGDDFYFLLSLVNFHEDIGEWPENQILIPDWPYFHCPGASLIQGTDKNNNGLRPLAKGVIS